MRNEAAPDVLHVEDGFPETAMTKCMTLFGVQDKDNNVQRFLVKKNTPIRKLKEAYCMITNRIVSKTWFSTDGSSEIGSIGALEEGDIIWVHDLHDNASHSQG